MLFLTRVDLAPLLVLAVALTGRNGETLKELPAAHELLEGRAVAVEAIKRRRGKAGAVRAVHWEVDARPSRQLHSPGSFYLLLHTLTERSRGFCGSDRIWSVWAGGANMDAEKEATRGHVDPFARHLGGGGLGLTAWAARHDLLGDDGCPLQLSLNRAPCTHRGGTGRRRAARAVPSRSPRSQTLPARGLP